MRKHTAKKKTCSKCGDTRYTQWDTFLCDNCKVVIKSGEKLDVPVWIKQDGEHPKEYHFCSWPCLLRKISKVRCGYFLDLPHLMYSDKKEKGNAKEFWKAIRRFK